jgi:hypothetical protein
MKTRYSVTVWKYNAALCIAEPVTRHFTTRRGAWSAFALVAHAMGFEGGIERKCVAFRLESSNRLDAVEYRKESV